MGPVLLRHKRAIARLKTQSRYRGTSLTRDPLHILAHLVRSATMRAHVRHESVRESPPWIQFSHNNSAPDASFSVISLTSLIGASIYQSPVHAHFSTRHT